MRRDWRWASLPFGILALWLSYSHIGAPYITNDGYQYLDAASNFASGRCLCTRTALFDEQVAFGHFPVPFTHFAPGYPILMAFLMRVGVAAETAGYLLSAFGFLAVLWLLQDIALTAGARAWVAAAFGLIWITHAEALLYASTVGTESVFAALLLALVALIVRDVRSQGNIPVQLTGIGVLAGLSYWVRYPGLFLVGSAGVYLLARAWRTPRARRGAFAGLLGAALLTGSIQIRNAIYTGSWRGAFRSGGHPPRTVVIETIRSFTHLVTGDRVPLRLDFLVGLLLVSAALVSFFGIRAWIARDPRMKDINVECLAWALFTGAAYIGGVMLAALTTIAGDLPRYYFPVYPLFLACAAAACSAVARGWKSLAVILLVISAVSVESRNLFVRPAQPDWILTRAMLAEEVQPGTPLLEWLRDRVSADGAILAVEGQAVHYVLQRPVVAVIPSTDTSRRTDEQGFRSLMLQFGSRYLLLFPNAPAERVPEQNSYGFLRSLAAGETSPWLKLAAHTRDAAVYECADCAH
jgi:uncharacterized membrane protein (UPF0136 family)